jgi:hypothetical protein
VERVLGGAHDWLSAHVEADIDQHRTAVQSIEARDQGVIPRVGVGVDRLDARRIVDMRDCRNIRTRDVELVYPEQRASRLACALPVVSHRSDQQHVGRIDAEIEPACHLLAQHRWCKGQKLSRYFTFRFSVFCMVVERGSARIERAPSARGSEFDRALEQADRIHRLDHRSRESIPYTVESVNPLGYLFLDNRVLSRTHTHRRRKGIGAYCRGRRS